MTIAYLTESTVSHRYDSYSHFDAVKILEGCSEAALAFRGQRPAHALMAV